MRYTTTVIRPDRITVYGPDRNDEYEITFGYNTGERYLHYLNRAEADELIRALQITGE